MNAKKQPNQKMKVACVFIFFVFLLLPLWPADAATAPTPTTIKKPGVSNAITIFYDPSPVRDFIAVHSGWKYRLSDSSRAYAIETLPERNPYSYLKDTIISLSRGGDPDAVKKWLLDSQRLEAAQTQAIEIEKNPAAADTGFLQSLTDPAGAVAVKLSVPLGNKTSVGPENPMGEYLKLWFEFILGTVGIIAAVVIMYAGLRWLASRGNAQEISDAKDRIFSAVIGLILAFLAYTILNLVNPSLTTIKTPAIPGVQEVNLDLTIGTESQSEDYTSSSANYPINATAQTSNLNLLRRRNNSITVGNNVRVDGLNPEIIGIATSIRDDSGTDMTITSGYRPGDGTSNHASGSAMDFSRQNPNFNAYMEALVSSGQPAGSYNVRNESGQTVSFPIYNVTFPNGETGRVINEFTTGTDINRARQGETRTVGNCWHIDMGR